MQYLGDFAEDATVRFMWNSNAVAGESITRATNGTISVYKDGNTTQSTAGVTDTEDFDSLTGVHLVAIDTSADAFYVAGAEYAVVLSAATIDGKTINAVLAHFSIERSGGALALIKARTPNAAAGAAGGLTIAGSNAATTFATLTITGAMSINGTGNVAQTGDSFARLGANGAGLSAIPWNASWDAEVQSECTDALNAYDPPTNAEMEARTLAAADYFDPAADTVLANVKKVNDVSLTGDGSATPWGPA